MVPKPHCLAQASKTAGVGVKLPAVSLGILQRNSQEERERYIYIFVYTFLYIICILYMHMRIYIDT